MFNAYARIFWRRILIFCLLKVVWCNRWDPLPEDVRNVVSSNHLGEGTPMVFAEYHALLPDFRGDYGVKSELVEAATQEPVYKGSNTFLLPLYIPQGAIPLGINERSTRSGKADSLPNMRILRGPLPSLVSDDSNINRSVTRRILLTGRRPLNEARTYPTPPPSFVRSWIKREPDSAEVQDYVEEAKRSKQRLLTQRRLEGTTKAENNVSTSTLPSIIAETRKQNDSSNKEVTRIKKIMTRLEYQPAKLNNTESTSTVSSTSVVVETTSTITDFMKISKTETPAAVIVTEDTKVNSETQNFSLFRVEGKMDSNLKANISETMSTESPETLKLPLERTNNITIESSTFSAETSTTANQLNSKRGRNTTTVFSKQHRQQVENINSRIRIKPVVPSSASTKLKTINEEALTSSTQSPTTPVTTSSPPDINPESTQRNASKSPHKSPSWLLRRRATLMKEINLRKEKQKSQDQKEEEINEEIIEETESIIDRVLNSASQSSNNNLHMSQSDNKSNDINSLDEITNIELLTNSEKPSKLVTTTPLSTSQPATSTQSTTELLMARQRVPIRTRRPIVSNPLVSSTTPLSYFLLNDDKNLLTSSFDFEDVKTIESVSTNAITTSTPKVAFQNFQPQTPKHLEKFLTDVTYQSPKSFLPPTRKVFLEKPHSILASAQKMKSPQDIVLEKLSELMKNATEGKKDSLHDIALEIEKLNVELASMGIHIIDAEFDGHKIRLRDQLKSNSTGANFSGATTIRYLIPNTKSKSKPQKESLPESFTKHNLEVGSPHRSSDNSREKHFDRVVNVTVNNRPTERTFFTLTRSENPPNRKVSASEDKHLSNENTYYNSETITDFPITIQSFLEVERSSNSRGISVTVAETTSAPIIIPDNLSSKLPLGNKYVYDTSLDVSPENLNPTSHLRPSSSSSDIISITKIPNVTKINSTGVDNSSNVTKGALYPNTFDDNSNNPLIMLVSSVGNMQDTVVPMDELEDSGSYIYFIGLLGIIPCIAAVAFLYRQRHKKEMKSLPQREERAEVFTPPINHPRPVGHNDTLDAFPGYIFQESEARESPWELPRSKLRITSVIGEGHFGMVWKAEARHLCDWEEDGGPTVLVAVKGVKEVAGAKEKSDLLRELAIMQLLGQHNNVVTLLGCCTKQEPFYLIMEYVMFGKLLEFLRDQRSKNNYFNFSSDSEHLTSRDLTKFAFQIATGCEYMQSRGVIHRDLAARNILLDHNKICKISDFGLARSVKDMDNDIYEQKSKGPLPIRWMAPESLFMNIFTHKSDVWSFGILCWEIVTLGSTPYPGISAREVMRRVREGYRLERPEHCRSELYKIVSKCWHQDINKRSSFATVKGELRELLDNPSGWVDLENFQEATYYSMHQNNEEKL